LAAKRKRQSGNWLMEAESTSASGGHIAPASSESALGTVEDEVAADERDERQTSEPDASQRGSGRERTEVIPRGSLKTDEGRATTAPRGTARRARPTVRRVKRTVRHIDPLSVLRLSLFYYACLLVLGLVVVAIVYAILVGAGLVEQIEKLGRAFVLWDDVDISLWFVERWALLVGLTLAVVSSLVNVFLAFLYNLAADVIGGAEVTFVERDV
jgi:hypothetical protein